MESTPRKLWLYFSAQEKRNIAMYILGIMFYKFGLEAYNGAIITLATNRYEQDAFTNGISPRTFEKVGLLSGLNQAFQCVGSVLIGPLIKRWPTRTVLSVSIFLFAPFTAVLMIVDAATGGRIKPTNFQPAHDSDFSYYGRYNTNWIIPIYCITGITFGMIEVIRRVIPKDIVGNDVQKLQRMNALASIFFEIAGTSGTFVTGLVLIPRFGNNYAFIVTPFLFAFAGISWIFITSSQLNTAHPKDQEKSENTNSKSNYLTSIIDGFRLFAKTIFVGGKIIFTNRKFIWLWSGYSLALYAHKYLENGIAPQIARRYLGNSDWSEIIIGGSNLGELLGALFTFICASMIKTPMPWLRLDAVILLIVWYIPYFHPPAGSVKYAWMVAATFVPISFGWAAAEVSLGAYIQSSMGHLEAKYADISPLGAVMAFLYSSYIIIYAIANPLLGLYLDKVYYSTGSVRPALVYTVGVQMTIISALVFASTFIPKGAVAFNPSLLHEKPSLTKVESQPTI